MMHRVSAETVMRAHFKVRLAAACSLAAFATAASAADTYPSKPIRMICPFATGSTADLMARVAAQSLTDALSRQVVVDNRTGAGGNIGAEIVAKAQPDGYTLLTNGSNQAINVTLYPTLPFDTLHDFVPISQLAHAPHI